jgi:hypothetical protein
LMRRKATGVTKTVGGASLRGLRSVRFAHLR